SHAGTRKTGRVSRAGATQGSHGQILAGSEAAHRPIAGKAGRAGPFGGVAAGDAGASGPGVHRYAQGPGSAANAGPGSRRGAPDARSSAGPGAPGWPARRDAVTFQVGEWKLSQDHVAMGEGWEYQIGSPS